MKRVTIRNYRIIPPFDESARDLRILNKPLFVLQRDLLSPYCRGALEVDSLEDIPASDEELLVYQDNLFFNEALISTFVSEARASKQACQIAFSKDDQSIAAHALVLQDGIRPQGDLYVADLYYFPHGVVDSPQPLVIDTEPREMGYYNIPSYMATHQGDLVFHVPLRAFLSIESWVHVFLANSPFGVFAWGRAQEQRVEESWKEKLAISFTTLFERLNPFSPPWRNNFLSCSRLVQVGKNCSIDPSAIIHGPTIIGNNVTIGAGVVITNSVIGNNVTVMQGSQIMLSVISDRCYIPWNVGLFMTTLMDNSMIAQLSCLQMCVVGRNTFIGAGNIFTDFNLVGQPLQTFHLRPGMEEPQREDIGLPVIGSAIGHNCKIGSGFVFYPARMIGSHTTLIYGEPATAISRNVNVRYHIDPQSEHSTDVEQTEYIWPQRLRDNQSTETSDGTAMEHFEMSLTSPVGLSYRRSR